MGNNRLVTCEYCRGCREYEDGKSCPGCGAPLSPPKEKPRADWQHRNDGLHQQQLQQQIMEMQSMSQQQMMNQQMMNQQMGQMGGNQMGQMGGNPFGGFYPSTGGKGGW